MSLMVYGKNILIKFSIKFLSKNFFNRTKTLMGTDHGVLAVSGAISDQGSQVGIPAQVYDIDHPKLGIISRYSNSTSPGDNCCLQYPHKTRLQLTDSTYKDFLT